MTRTMAEIDPALADALGEAKQRLQTTFGERLAAVIPYGSRARGDFEEDSDVDLMVVLEPELSGDRQRANAAVYHDILIETGFMLSAWTVDADVFRKGEFYIYRAATREGIVL